MKTKTFLILLSLLTFSGLNLHTQTTLAADRFCPTFKDIKNSLSEFAKLIWEPNFRSECKESEAPAQCKAYIQQLKSENKNWQGYLEICQKDQPALLYPLSCTKSLEEIATAVTDEIANSMNRQFEQQTANAECSKDPKNKQYLLDYYNQRVPKLLQFKDKDFIDSLLKKDCQEISNFLTAHKRNRMAALTQRIPFYVKPNELTPDESNFLAWKQAQLKPFEIGDSLWTETEKFLMAEMAEFQCMSTYRRTETTCKAVIGLLLLKRPKLKLAPKNAFHQTSVYPSLMNRSALGPGSKTAELEGIFSAQVTADGPLQSQLSDKAQKLIAKIDKLEAEQKARDYARFSKDLKPQQKITLPYKNSTITVPVEKITPEGIHVTLPEGRTILPFDVGYEIKAGNFFRDL